MVQSHNKSDGPIKQGAELNNKNPNVSPANHPLSAPKNLDIPTSTIYRLEIDTAIKQLH
jgi:hypothetical protein